MVRASKREAVATDLSGRDERNGSDEKDRRVLRSRYLAVKSTINNKRDELISTNSDNFNSIINEVESLHQLVQKPREQVADAEALLDITNTLVTSVKAHSSEGITPSEFVGALLRTFGQPSGSFWNDIGAAVSDSFRRSPGCCTMIGPMSTEIKLRKPVVRKKHVRPTESSRPEELDDSLTKEKTDTDKNMATMFNILRKNRGVRLESLILNRHSFAQTVENLFTLSFLVKDGRVEIKVDEKGCHLVSPRNAPSADAIASGEVTYSHFVFRFDYMDWKLMCNSVENGEELMPHRHQLNMTNSSQLDQPSEEPQATGPSTPIRKLSRNRGLVLQEQVAASDSPGSDELTVVEDSPMNDDDAARVARLRKGKRKMR
ncbi:hypothetical protein UlMin_005159 [Ulmus minor]